MNQSDQTLQTIAMRLNVTSQSLNYLIHYDQKKDIAYFETPKVACTSIKKYMQDQVNGGKRELKNKSDVHDRSKSPLRPISELPPEKIKEIFFGGVKRFTFVRNPYSRLLSGYLDKIVTNEWERKRHFELLGFSLNDKPSLEDVLLKLKSAREIDKDIHFAKQARLVCFGDVQFDYIGSFENFNRDFATIKSAFYGDLDTDNYSSFGKHHASNASEKLQDYFDDDTALLAREVYQNDFKAFGYSLDLKDAIEPPELPHLTTSTTSQALLVRYGLDDMLGERPFSITAEVNLRVHNKELTPIAASELLLRFAEGDKATVLKKEAALILRNHGFLARARNIEENLS
jgi:hypothetical protein